jgi:hypothetical protein|tara:strand:+ start:1065 stop:1208 length:144 start_codon:yes stop_codon:yes gene_type:complete
MLHLELEAANPEKIGMSKKCRRHSGTLRRIADDQASYLSVIKRKAKY